MRNTGLQIEEKCLQNTRRSVKAAEKVKTDRLVIGEVAASLQEVAVRVQLLGHDMIVYAVPALLVEHLHIHPWSLRPAASIT